MQSMPLDPSPLPGAHVLRSGWRVVGVLSGALPQQPRQNTRLALPLLLSSEEVTLLRERGERARV